MRNESCDMQVREIPWMMSREWMFDEDRFRHISGGFFSVTGAAAYRQGHHVPALDQPLIDQPEIGILGFAVADDANGRDILVQGKPEPGNVNLVQAAPTVQATESNYLRRHHGKATPLLGYFLSDSGASVLSDSLQSEQGTRFLGKYNRNMLVQVRRDCIRPDNGTFRWFTLRALLALLTQDFMINTDARSVLTTAPWAFLAGNGKPFTGCRERDVFCAALWRSYAACGAVPCFSLEEIVTRLATARNNFPFRTIPAALSDLSSWVVSDSAISSIDANLPSIRQYDVSTTEREIEHWDQPLFTAPREGLAVLFCQIRNGVLHFLFNCRAEIGFREGLQYGPTIQDTDDGAFIIPVLGDLEHHLRGYLARTQVQVSCLHSDEGGRFHRCISRYMICTLDPDDHIECGHNLTWMTLSQIEVLARRPGFFSNEARSLISMLLTYL